MEEETICSPSTQRGPSARVCVEEGHEKMGRRPRSHEELYQASDQS